MLLWRLMLVRTHAPVHLDRGKSNIAHKCAALVWTWMHEVHDMSSLLAFQASYRFINNKIKIPSCFDFTLFSRFLLLCWFMITDLGVESGVPYFRAVDGLRSLVPSWRDIGWTVEDGLSASLGEESQHLCLMRCGPWACATCWTTWRKMWRNKHTKKSLFQMQY